jgi:hypothetical protein
MKPENENTRRSPRPNKIRTGTASHTALVDLKAYQDGELPVWRRWLVQAHLVCCGVCREEAAWLKRLGEDMKDLERATPSPRLRARILASLPDTPPSAANRVVRGMGSRRTALTGWPRLALASMGALLLLFGAAFAATRFSNLITTAKHGPQPGSTIVDNDKNPRTQPRTSPSAPQEEVVTPVLANPLQNLPDPNDTYNRYATEQLRKQEDEQVRRAGRLLEQNRVHLKQALAALLKEGAKDHTSASVRIPLELTVPDVAVAQKRLLAWAQEVGGGASDHIDFDPRVKPLGAAPPATATGPRISHPGGTGEDADNGVVVVLKIPAKRARELPPILKQLGVLPIPGDPTASSHGGGLLGTSPPTYAVSAQGDKNGGKTTTVKVQPGTPITTNKTPGQLPPPQPSESGPPVLGHEKAPLVTLLVHLQAFPPAL